MVQIRCVGGMTCLRRVPRKPLHYMGQTKSHSLLTPCIKVNSRVGDWVHPFSIQTQTHISRLSSAPRLSLLSRVLSAPGNCLPSFSLVLFSGSEVNRPLLSGKPVIISSLSAFRLPKISISFYSLLFASQVFLSLRI